VALCRLGLHRRLIENVVETPEKDFCVGFGLDTGSDVVHIDFVRFHGDEIIHSGGLAVEYSPQKG
jgi:DNA-binding GntR family transcriptional regulator